jgi:ABC-type transport system involved in multi-copper enzyme maturation permease subunit
MPRPGPAEGRGPVLPPRLRGPPPIATAVEISAMVLEEEIPRFASWIGPALAGYGLTAALVALAAAVIAWLVQAAVAGPLTAGDRVYRGLLAGLADLAGISPRRVWALARLAVQESLRRNVLVVLAVFAAVLLFAGWFLDPASVNPGKLYLGFILSATAFLVCTVTLLLAVFSLPADIKSRAIQTVTTKPVRTSEIVLGRVLGFSLIGTGLLAIMAVAGWAFVVRSIAHDHDVAAEDLLETRDESGKLVGFTGRTSLDRGHRHRVMLDADGRGTAETGQGHRHQIRRAADGRYQVGPAEGLLEARRPLRGSLRFLDRQGKPSAKGISVGSEWAYRQFIEGGTPAAAIWTFTGVDAARFPDGLPLEMIVRVFRTHKGRIEDGIHGTVQVRNPVTNLRSEALPIVAKEFTIDALQIPRRLATRLVDGEVREVDLFDDFVADGAVEIWLQCLEPGQYYGVAAADFYLRTGDGSFALNYLKSCLGIWFSMLVVTALGVMLSTFLAGPVALLTALGVILIGQFRGFIAKLFESQVTGDNTIQPGGGPLESLVRIATQESITLQWDPTPAAQAIKAIDTLLLAPMRLAAGIFPSLADLGTGNFVAEGFDIPFDLLAAHATEACGFIIAFCVAGAFFLKSREVAS